MPPPVTTQALTQAINMAARRGLSKAAEHVARHVKKLLSLKATTRGGPAGSMPGEPPAKRTGTLGRGVTVDLSGLTRYPPVAHVRMQGVPYARIQELGGVIPAKRVKYLPVPVNRAARLMLLRVGSGGLKSIGGLYVMKMRTTRNMDCRT